MYTSGFSVEDPNHNLWKHLSGMRLHQQGDLLTGRLRIAGLLGQHSIRERFLGREWVKIQVERQNQLLRFRWSLVDRIAYDLLFASLFLAFIGYLSLQKTDTSSLYELPLFLVMRLAFEWFGLKKQHKRLRQQLQHLAQQNSPPTSPKRASTLLYFAKKILFGYCLFAVFVWFFADLFIYQPPVGSTDPKIEILTNKHGSDLSYLFIPNESAKFTILYSHGNAEDLSTSPYRLSLFFDLGFQVFAYDPSGYGLSAGYPSVQNAKKDIEVAFEFLVQELKVPSQSILLWGRSVGTGPTVHLSTNQKVAGVVLESPYLSLLRVVTQRSLLPFDFFNNEEQIAEVRSPLLILHGKRDSVIPFWHGEQLFQAAKASNRAVSKYWFNKTHHNNVLSANVSKVEKLLADWTASLQ